jgi:hypothetical protein
MLIPKVNILQECQYLYGALLKNQSSILRCSIIALSMKVARVKALIDDLTPQSQVFAEFFTSGKDLCSEDANNVELIADREQLERRLFDAKARYRAVSIQLDKEERVPRRTRILNVISEFQAFYQEKKELEPGAAAAAAAAAPS